MSALREWVVAGAAVLSQIVSGECLTKATFA